MKYILIILITLFAISALIGWFVTREDTTNDGAVVLRDGVSPESVVDAFYESWLSEDDALEDMAYDDSTYVTRAFVLQTDELRDASLSAGYDPIVCAADEPEAYEVSTVEEDRDTAEVLVRFDREEERNEARVHLVFDHELWKIRAIDCTDTASD